MTVHAVMLDALGTLVELEPPAPLLRESLRARTGVDVGDDAALRGVEAEIGFYMANHMRGGTPEGLEALRAECAGVLHEALAVEGLDRADVLASMLESLRFTAFPDVSPALHTLRELGVITVIVSNWDRSLPDAMATAGLASLIDHTVSSAVVGVAKPDPAPVLAGLAAAGVEPGEAVFVGDSPESDLVAARAAGVRGILVARHGHADPSVETIASLEDLPSLF